MGHREGEREGELPTLCSSCQRQGIRLPPLPSPALVYCSRAQQAASAGNAPHPSFPLVPHATCPLCNIRAIDAAAIEAENEKGKRNGATCHLPPATHLGGRHSCCTVVCLAIESALSYLPRGQGGVAGLIDGPHLPHGSAQLRQAVLACPIMKLALCHKSRQVVTPSPRTLHDKTIEYLWALAEQIMRQGLSCHCELPLRVATAFWPRQ